MQTKHSAMYNPQKNQTRLTDGFITISKAALIARKKSRLPLERQRIENANHHLINWIINHSQPFNVVEQEHFLLFCDTLAEGYTLPSRDTVRKWVLKRWELARSQIRCYLLKHIKNRKCSITTDMWTSAAKKGNIVISVFLF